MFDLLAFLMICVSTAIGYARGALREIVTLAAFALAVLVAVLILPASRLLFGLLVHPRWLATAAGIAVVFVLAYFGVRVLGAALTTRLHATSFGGIDRLLGAGVGVARALIILGLVALVLESAPWPNGKPRWLARAWSYPVAHVSGRAVARLAPKTGALFGGFSRFVGSRVAEGFGGDAATPASDPPARHRLDDPLERAR